MSDTAEVAGSSKFAKVSDPKIYHITLHTNSLTILIKMFLLCIQAFTVPAEFPEVLRTLVREILRSQPQSAEDINKFGKKAAQGAV